jgi:hypothetical protein
MIPYCRSYGAVLLLAPSRLPYFRSYGADKYLWIETKITLEPWNSGTLELWNPGTLEHFTPVEISGRSAQSSLRSA